MNTPLSLAALLVGGAALLYPSAPTTDLQPESLVPAALNRSIVYVCPVPRTFDGYARDCADVVVGRVVAQRQIVVQTGISYREVDLDVLGSAKGKVPSRLTVDVLGVRTDTVEVLVPAAPQFAVGEEVALFLLQDARTDRWGILGLSEGTARATRDADGAMRLHGPLVEGETSASFFDRVLDRCAAQDR